MYTRFFQDVAMENRLKVDTIVCLDDLYLYE